MHKPETWQGQTQQVGDVAPGGAASQARGSAAPGENNGASLPRPLSQGQQWQEPEPELPELIAPLRARRGPGQAGGHGLRHKGSLPARLCSLRMEGPRSHPSAAPQRSPPSPGEAIREGKQRQGFGTTENSPGSPRPPSLLPRGPGMRGPFLAADWPPDPPSSCFVSRCARALSARERSGGVSLRSSSISPAPSLWQAGVPTGPTDPVPGGNQPVASAPGHRGIVPQHQRYDSPVLLCSKKILWG